MEAGNSLESMVLMHCYATPPDGTGRSRLNPLVGPPEQAESGPTAIDQDSR